MPDDPAQIEMSDEDPSPDGASPADALPLDRDGWTRAIEEIGENAGYWEPLGPRHSVLFTDEGPTLLVTFEEGSAIRARRGGRLPAGLALARGRGWSHLCLIAEGETWFRDAAVYRYFDRLVDDAFFEDFDRVVFFGAGMGGYAAAAYAVAAPGATVLAVQPRATLDPAVAGWDPRHPRARRLCFTDRYGYAPDMIEGAGRTFVVFDPAEALDAMHAALFRRPFVTMLRARRLGAALDRALMSMGVLDGLIVDAAEGRLDTAGFARALRRRRSYGPYLRQMLATADAAGRTGHARRICRSVAARLRAPAFRRRLLELEEGPRGG